MGCSGQWNNTIFSSTPCREKVTEITPYLDIITTSNWLIFFPCWTIDSGNYFICNKYMQTFTSWIHVHICIPINTICTQMSFFVKKFTAAIWVLRVIQKLTLKLSGEIFLKTYFKCLTCKTELTALLFKWFMCIHMYFSCLYVYYTLAYQVIGETFGHFTIFLHKKGYSKKKYL